MGEVKYAADYSADGVVWGGWGGGRGGPTLSPEKKFPSKVSAIMGLFVSSTIRTSKRLTRSLNKPIRAVWACVLYESHFESASRSLDHLGRRVKIHRL